MAATADTEMMRAKGIADKRFSRANDRRRLGFVEAQGGGIRPVIR
ncbi:fatty acid synthase Fas [Mycobacteroides abscessus subsp. abscessus]|nr:fatty acid synthase Fas [Mycobacteroides abscessus subsp. abscessus]